MSAYLIIYTAAALATLALVWAAREFNLFARSFQPQPDWRPQEADATWARTLASLERESAQRRLAKAPARGPYVIGARPSLA